LRPRGGADDGVRSQSVRASGQRRTRP
jgi:hypothetical protein